MDKLETYFVNIVSRARQSKAPTSGAEAGTGVKGFLAGQIREKAPEKEVLDRLVSASMRPPSPEPDTRTEKASNGAEEARPEKKELLDKLSKTSLESAESVSETTKPSPAPSPEPPRPVRKDLLEELIDRGRRSDGRTEPTDSSDAEGNTHA